MEHAAEAGRERCVHRRHRTARACAHAARHAPTRALAVVLATLVTAACGEGGGVAAGGDLAEIRARGQLRILVQRRRPAYLPRSGSFAERERGLASSLARELSVEPVIVEVEAFADLIPALLAGKGDLIADSLTVTETRRAQVVFSAPVAVGRDHVVTGAAREVPKEPAELAGRTLYVPEASSFIETAGSLAAQVSDLSIVRASSTVESEALLEDVAAGDLDLTIADGHLLDEVAAWLPDLRVGFAAGGDRAIAWAMRPESAALRRAVDRFLARRGAAALSDRFAGDLPELRERGVLRVLTRNSATTYFIHRGELVGFEHDLVLRLARSLGLRLELVVPPTRGDLLPWLREGRGDLVAAGLSASAERERREGVRFSRMYHEAQPMLVARAGEIAPQSFADLRGRTVIVRESSSYWPLLAAFETHGFTRVAAPEDLETEQIIARVASGEYDLTVADSDILGVEMMTRTDVQPGFALAEPEPHAWAVRPDSERLLEAIDAFLDAEYRGVFYNVTKRKYFEDERAMRRRNEARPTRAGAISPYDAIVRRLAERYGFDWRLIVAQMHQESRFDPTARSFAGARGLMQVLPATGAELGFSDLEDPEQGIGAGIAYLAWVRERLDAGIPDEELRWFALAGYNVGYNHVRDARRIAERLGLDPNRWFGHVEQALLAKQDPAVYRRSRFGYCRCAEPVEYVRSIHARYRAYLDVVAAH